MAITIRDCRFYPTSKGTIKHSVRSSALRMIWGPKVLLCPSTYQSCVTRFVRQSPIVEISELLDPNNRGTTPTADHRLLGPVATLRKGL